MFRIARENKLLFICILVALLAGVGYTLASKYNWLKTVANILIAVQAIITASVIIWRQIDTLRLGSRAVDFIGVSAILLALWVRNFWIAIALCIVYLATSALMELVEKRVSNTESMSVKSTNLAVVLRGRKQISIDVSKISKGDKLLIKKGAAVPVDGLIIDGDSIFDESWLNSDSSVKKSKGDMIYGRSLNTKNEVTIRALSGASNSLAQNIAHTYETARFSPAPFINTSEIFTLLYTSVVVVFGVGAVILGGKQQLLAALVAAVPFIFIATVRPIFSMGINRAGKRGIFFRSARSLELSASLENVLMTSDFLNTAAQSEKTITSSLKGYIGAITVIGANLKTKLKNVSIVPAKDKSEKIMIVEKLGSKSGVGFITFDTNAEHSLLQAADLGIQFNAANDGLSQSANVCITTNELSKLSVMISMAKWTLSRCRLLIAVISIISILLMGVAALGYVSVWDVLGAHIALHLFIIGYLLVLSKSVK